jgi:hypothetical protein
LVVPYLHRAQSAVDNTTPDYGSMYVEVSDSSPLTGSSHAPAFVDGCRPSSQLALPMQPRSSSDTARPRDNVPELMPVQVEASVELEPPMRARVVTAAVNFGLTAYAALTVGAVKALHCVHAPGTLPSERRLFIQGTLACDYGGWQAPYVVLGVVLVGTPTALPFLAAWARQPTGGVVRRGVRRALVDPYRDGAYWWEAVLMAQRLVRRVLKSRMSTRLSAVLWPDTVLSYAPVVWVGVLLRAEHFRSPERPSAQGMGWGKGSGPWLALCQD